MNALAIPQTSNIKALHPRMCAHCGQKPPYAPNAIYCGTSCTNKAYRARKRERAATIAQEQTQNHRIEQLLTIVEQQAQQIAALTELIQKQPIASTSAPSFHGNLKPAAAPAEDLIDYKPATKDTNGGKNLLAQLLQATQTNYTAKKMPALSSK